MMADGGDGQPTTPQAFLSYAHHDDKFLRGGVEHLREDLEDAIQFVTGEPFEIFLDKDGIEFGQHWPTRLKDQLREARFLIPIISPSYFKSDHCKHEAVTFLQYEEKMNRNDLILPIYLVDASEIFNSDDELAGELRQRQYQDFRELVFEERTSPARGIFVKEIATEISKTLKRSSSKGEDNKVKKSRDEPVIVSDLKEILDETNVHITLSRRKIVIGGNAVDTMRNFWHHLEVLYKNSQSKNTTDRTFLWVIDVGSQLAEQPFSFDEYFNAGLLALQFQSFYRFDSIKDYGDAGRLRLFQRRRAADAVHRMKRWQWLSERSVVAVQNLRRTKSGPTWVEDIGINAEHVLPSATPALWIKQIQHLYGEEVDVADATITVFLDEPTDADSHSAGTAYYFAHALASGKSMPSIERMTDIIETSRSVELVSPGKNYDDAYRLLYAAACYRLGLEKGIDPEESLRALAYIERIGFDVLTLPNFLRRFSRVFDIMDDN